ncbi:MAG: hypothetical protein KatS3mg081_2576 [Gemmatimonadales bacterium]|nr:MAG: hypothetical protein KatS3mg081_2576 [Gemmatimonadales bacterium]
MGRLPQGRTAFALAALYSSLLGGCAAPRGAGDPAPRALAPQFARRVSPFPVVDHAGVPYDYPFLGGFNVPRPQLVDIDGDGDVDLFLQEATGSVMYFEQVREGSGRRFVWRSDRYQELEVGEWYRFADLDGDGDYDLLAEQPFSYIRVYRNDGTPQSPRFVLAADTLKDAEGNPIFSDRQNIPNLTDIDCDAGLDLFLGRVDGTVTRYREEHRDAGGLPRFRFAEDRWEGIEIVQRFGSVRHGANTLVFHDLDGDGDEDLLWGDFFEPGLLLIENRGSCSSPMLRSTPQPFPRNNPVSTSGYNAAAFGDIDGDGRADLLVGVLGGAYNPNRTSSENLHYYRRTGAADFELVTTRFIYTVDVGSESIPAVGDLDGDGDLDLLLANKIDPENLQTSRIYWFENVGTPLRPEFRLRGSLGIEGDYHYAPALGDLDGDGDLDLLLGTFRDRLMLYRNEGTGGRFRFVLADTAFVVITRGSNTTPALGDLDGDGDLDLLIGEGSGTLNFYRNEGTRTEPRFVLVSDEFLGLDAGRRSAPVLADVDGDGDLDLLLGSEAGVVLYRNVGTREAFQFVRDSTFELSAPPFAAPALGDLDGDGDLDLLLGGLGGGLVYFENLSAARRW